MEQQPALSSKFNTLLLYCIAFLVIVTSIYVRIRLSGAPLERDEGEYAYMGQLLLKGFPPYTNAYTMKLPGVALVYTLVMSVFGQSATGIHTGLLLVNIMSTGLVYLLGRRFLSRDTALIAAAFFALLSLSQSVLGAFAHATHFVVLFSLAGIVLLDHGLNRKQTFLLLFSGICFGLAFLMKQHSAIIIIFAVIFQIWPQREDIKKFCLDCCLFMTGAILPCAVVTLWLFNAGVFDRFWFWTFLYAREYVTGLSIVEGIKQFFSQFTPVVIANLPIWLLATTGVVVLYRGPKPRTEKLFLAGYLAASFIMVCPGLYFRPHYFVLLLPPVALLAAYVTTAVLQKSEGLTPGKLIGYAPLFLFAAASAYPFVTERSYNFTLSPPEVSRAIYGANPFPEAVQIAAYLRENTTEKDSIAILGSEPEILFYANRISATGHIYMYGLMEEHKYAAKMQAQLISEIESANPAFIVVVNNSATWLLKPGSLNKVLDWGDSYLSSHYEEVGIVEIYNDKPALYLSGEEIAEFNPTSGSFVSVFRRRF
jgi:hypothetical protein